jgi:hypothetical protein
MFFQNAHHFEKIGGDLLTSLPYFGLVISNGALGIAIVVVAFRSTTNR